MSCVAIIYLEKRTLDIAKKWDSITFLKDGETCATDIRINSLTLALQSFKAQWLSYTPPASI
jgi:hypothetical protein